MKYLSHSELQTRCAELFGKEKALFVPTGTMGNLLSGNFVYQVTYVNNLFIFNAVASLETHDLRGCFFCEISEPFEYNLGCYCLLQILNFL